MKVYSVVVCYRPDAQRLRRLCENLLSGGSKVILVDNTEKALLTDEPRPQGCESIELGLNQGIARAQNVGIAAATAAGADVIVFFDQDSVIDAGFLRVLVPHLHPGEPGIVSPRYLDDVTKAELPSLRMNRYGFPRPVDRRGSPEPYAVDIVISSGTAATRETFEVAGMLDEGLFIDFVDTEWCLRCREREVPIRVVPSAVMLHRIGSKSIGFGPLTVLVHSPIRCYYQLRNCFHLFRKRHIPVLFALREMAAVYLSRGLLLLFVRDRFAYAKAYLCAVRDGLKGVTGSKPNSQ